MIRLHSILSGPIFIIGFLMLGLGGAVAGPNDDPRCEGLSGAAFGMCASAIAIGCDDPNVQISGCDKITENYTKITGAPPPWDCQLTIDPSDQYYERFEGISGVSPSPALQTCNTDSDCIQSGCSNEVCAAQNTDTTCEFLSYYPTGNCLCVAGLCQWALCAE